MAGPTTLFQTGNHAGRPAANAGCVLYWCTTHSKFYRSDASAWSDFADLSALGGGSALTVKDEGSNLSTAATSLDFVGAGVTATNVGAAITVTISGGGSGATAAVTAAGNILAAERFR